MAELIFPANYDPKLTLRETQRAIKMIKDTFQTELALALNLDRITAPIIVKEGSGINDDLNGVERPVAFPIKDMDEQRAEVVHSLAKWKRYALYKYGFSIGEGIVTDMNAIRRDENTDAIHSIYVDQWDWEKVITKEQRTEEYLREVVTTIYNAMKNLGDYVNRLYRGIQTELPNEIFFVTTQELEDMYPDITGSEREKAYVKEHHTACIMQIGGKLRSGKPHDGRAPDYDDWDLNCDIFFWDALLQRPLEISSMGIRVDEAALDRQLTEAGCDHRRELPFHKMLLAGELPLTIGGGIGQSRLSMLMMGCAHIGEVQSSVWDQETMDACEKAGIRLL